MTEKTEKQNTFDKMEKENSSKKPETTQTPSKELTLDDFSNVAVGDKVKYNRPDLNDKEDIVDKFQVFMPDIAKDEIQVSQSGATEYWKVSMCISYESKNDDDIQNREYISGAKVFCQKDGSVSEPQFWYEGAENQSAMLWETVAAAKKIDADRLSPREFIAFLNNRPKVLLESKGFKNFGAPEGSPKKIYKNMPKEFK